MLVESVYILIIFFLDLLTCHLQNKKKCDGSSKNNETVYYDMNNVHKFNKKECSARPGLQTPIPYAT